MLLELRQICKSYKNPGSSISRPVLDDLSMRVDPGETIAILGPSGSGKSTLLNIIGALDKADSGEVVFNGEMINAYNDRQLASFRNREIGFVFQSHHLLPQCTVTENVLIPTLTFRDKAYRKECRSRALELIREVGLWDHRDKFPGTLSGGECQRVAAIRALINRPKLVLADEPTGSLDRANALATVGLLSKLHREFNSSLIVVTHSEEIGRHMDKVYRLVDGQLDLA